MKKIEKTIINYEDIQNWIDENGTENGCDAWILSAIKEQAPLCSELRQNLAAFIIARVCCPDFYLLSDIDPVDEDNYQWIRIYRSHVENDLEMYGVININAGKNAKNF